MAPDTSVAFPVKGTAAFFIAKQRRVRAAVAAAARRFGRTKRGYMPSFTTCQTLPTPSPVVSPGLVSLTQ